MIYVGIDPGTDGAVAFILPDNKIRVLKFKSDLQKALHFFRQLKKESTLVALEDVHAVFGSAATATFSFGREVGRVIGILQALELEFIMVSPFDWQARICNVLPKASTWGFAKPVRDKMNRDHKKLRKIESCRAAHVAFSDLDTKHDGICDAVNIARYCKIYHEGKGICH